MSINNIILTTGGTGGHIFPAIAVAEEIRKRNPHAAILFLGSKYGIEADVVANAGFRFAGLPARGIMGKGLRGVVNALAMFRSVTSSLFLMRRLKPQAVLGFGGYAAFAETYAASLCHIPCAIHEQNAFPGLANKILGKRVDKVFVSMPGVTHFFPENKIIETGNPVREDIAHLATTYEERRQHKHNNPTKRLLVVGGSLGASAINTAMQHGMPKLLENTIEVWHQTGRQDYDSVRKAYREAGIEHVRVEAFITDMAQAYSWADIVLCRAGASTLAELTSVGLPSLLVPFPFAAQDHQRYNAQGMEKVGAAKILDQSLFAGDNVGHLLDTLYHMFDDAESLEAMSKAAYSIAKPFAAATIVDELATLITSAKRR